jgi:hypothetical protein
VEERAPSSTTSRVHGHRAADDLETLPAVLSELVADRAIVLVGDDHEVWDFPVEMLPEKVEVGTFLIVEMRHGRPTSVRVNEETEQVARVGIDARLARVARYEHLTGTEIRVG